MANAELILPVALPAAVVSALGTAAGFDTANMNIDQAGVIYRSAGGVASGYLQYDFGADVSIDRLMLFGLAGAPPGATVKIYSSTTAQGATYAGWVSAVLSLYAGTNRLVNGKGVAYAVIGAPASRYWRIEFASLASAQIDVSRIVLGAALVLERNFQFGAAFGFRDFSNVEFSNRAVLLRRKAKRLRTVGINFPMVNRDEIEAKVAPLQEAAGADTPVALITDPAASAMRERRCYFGVLQGDLGQIWRNARAWEVRADLVSLF